MPTPIPRPVRLLGWASLFTDAATEMIYPLLPIYLSRVLGASATSLGIVEGVAEGINSLLKIVSGWVSDRRGRRRPIVILGYGLSSIARPLIALTSSWPQVLAIRALDRTGKGIRGAPRDAMLAAHAAASSRGRIFGFHRAMDHTGAVVGPILATLFLAFFPGRYRLLFALTAIPGALAVATLFRVEERPIEPLERSERLERSDPASTSGPSTGSGPPRAESRDGEAGPERLPRQLYKVLGIILLFSLGSSADAFLLLRLADALGSATFLPLLWAAHHVVKASLSTWGGGLSDRLGRRYVIVIGWTIYSLVYLGFALVSDAIAFVALFLIYGVYFALAEGSEKALVADLTPPQQQGTSFGLYNGVLGIGMLVASIAFGFVYDRFSPAAAFVMGAVLSAAAAVLLLTVPLPNPRARIATAES
jgi:MFS family permease